MVDRVTYTDDQDLYDEVAISLNGRDLTGTPTNSSFLSAIYTDTLSLRSRSIFTDKGPIAKPALTIQSGTAAVVNSATDVTLPGATLLSSYVGLYVRLSQRGLPNSSSSTVLGSNVTLSESVSTPDSLVVDIIRPTSSRTVYQTLNGTYRIVGVVSSTRVRLQATFTIPEGANGSLYWDIIDPRNGQIADDPSDVMVLVNGVEVVPDAVIGLLGQVVLPSMPTPTDDVKIDYAWCANPTIECRRLNSKEFRLNSWNRDNAGTSTEQHRYRYNNVLVKPSQYVTLNSLSSQVQPKLRELHYRAYERAYTPALNDPTTLLLNSPTHKIAYPQASRTLTEEFTIYEGTTLPESSPDPWVRHGIGVTSTLAGVLTVVDNTSGPFPSGQPIFWTRPLDLTFPSAFALSWRMLITDTPVLDGVFTGVAVGYSDDLLAFVVGFLDVSGTKKVGFLKRGCGNTASLVSSWTGALDSDSIPTGLPVDFDWSVLHSYRLFKDPNGVVHLLVDGNVLDSLRITPSEAPFLEELNVPFNNLQGVFFGSLSRVAENTSEWDFVRYLILPTNPLQTGPSSFVSYEGTTIPEIAAKPWTPVGYHGTEMVLGPGLLLDSTSATDSATSSQVGLVGGDFRGFVRIEPLLLAASEVVLDVNVQLRTFTHGIDPYGLMFAVDDGSRLIQVVFLASLATPKFSYGGRSLPEDFSPYFWSSLGTAAASMVGRVLRISDTSASTGRVYYIEDLSPPTSDSRVIDVTTNYFLEFRCSVLSYTADASGFIGAFGQVSDGTRSVGIMLEDVSGTKYVTLHSDGVPVAGGRFTFSWGTSYHTYRLAKSTSGSLVSLFVDGIFIGSVSYTVFASTPGAAQVSFGSATSASTLSLSVVDWAYCNAWRSRSDQKRFVGLWKGFDEGSLTGYHLPLKTSGLSAFVSGNTLVDTSSNFLTSAVSSGDPLIIDVGLNKGTYTVGSVIDANTLTIIGSWPSSPSKVGYRIAKETDWSTVHKYRISKDPMGEVVLLLDAQPDALIRVGYNSLDLPESGVGIVKTLSNGLAAIVFGSFSPENLEQSWWDYVRYGVTRVPTELMAVPHHQVLNQWNVMESPERLTTSIPHSLTSYKSSSTGIAPKTDPDFLADPNLSAYTQLNEGTPLVPSTQTYEVRSPYPTQTNISTLSTPSDVLSNTPFTINDGSIQYELILPDDILYSSLDVIEQVTGDDAPITPFGDQSGYTDLGIQYTKTTCLSYTAATLPEDDTTAPTPWELRSVLPSDVITSVSSGILSYRSLGTNTVYLNNTSLVNSPSLTTEIRFRLRITEDLSLGSGDTLVRFGFTALGISLALAFVTAPVSGRYVIALDWNTEAILGSISFDFLDGSFHTYRLIRDPGAGVVRILIDS